MAAHLNVTRVTVAAIYHRVGIALVVQHSEETGRALGVNGVFGNLGVALAGMTTGALTGMVSWRAAFLLPGCMAVATTDFTPCS